MALEKDILRMVRRNRAAALAEIIRRRGPSTAAELAIEAEGHPELASWVDAATNPHFSIAACLRSAPDLVVSRLDDQRPPYDRRVWTVRER